jgi:hypothetical protein
VDHISTFNEEIFASFLALMKPEDGGLVDDRLKGVAGQTDCLKNQNWCNLHSQNECSLPIDPGQQDDKNSVGSNESCLHPKQSSPNNKTICSTPGMHTAQVEGVKVNPSYLWRLKK